MFSRVNLAPNGGTFKFSVGPSPLGHSTFTATAYGLPTFAVQGAQPLEVAQISTRAGGAANEHWYDIVVRNNSPTPCVYFEVMISMVA